MIPSALCGLWSDPSHFILIIWYLYWYLENTVRSDHFRHIKGPEIHPMYQLCSGRGAQSGGRLQLKALGVKTAGTPDGIGALKLRTVWHWTLVQCVWNDHWLLITAAIQTGYCCETTSTLNGPCETHGSTLRLIWVSLPLYEQRDGSTTDLTATNEGQLSVKVVWMSLNRTVRGWYIMDTWSWL